MDDRNTFLTITQARLRVGLSPASFRRRLDAGEFIIYVNPADARSRLLRVDDLNRFLTPRPSTRIRRPRREEAPTSPVA